MFGNIHLLLLVYKLGRPVSMQMIKLFFVSVSVIDMLNCPFNVNLIPLSITQSVVNHTYHYNNFYSSSHIEGQIAFFDI